MKQICSLYNEMIGVENALNGVAYRFIGEEDFKKIKSIQKSQLVYWSELVQRMHFCGATSIQRLRKWHDACIISYEAPNYYGFCASIRGLLEACADTFDTIGKILYLIAENFNLIKTALKGECNVPLISETIEDTLIHYTFARKLSKSEKVKFPSSHDAKQVRTYFESIDDEDVPKLYSELCQVSHPSMMSLIPFIMCTDEHGLILHKESSDKALIRRILDEHKDAIDKAIKLALLSAVSLLKLVNKFDVPITKSLVTKEDSLEFVEESKLWNNLLEAISSSQKD